MIKIKSIVIEALLGFVFWTVVLTPYEIFIMKLDLIQWFYWAVSGIILVPPLAVIAFRITNHFDNEKWRFVKQALIGFVIYTLGLTPYMILIVGMLSSQYLLWVFQQIVIVIPLSPLGYRFTKFLEEKVI